MDSRIMGFDKVTASATPLQRATVWALAGQVLVMILGFFLLSVGATETTAGLLILCLAANAVLAVVNALNIWPRKAKP